MTEETVSIDELAAFVGVSERTLREMTKRGHIVRAKKGRYDLRGSVRAYIAHLRGTAGGRGGDQAVHSLAIERARLARAQADAHEAKNRLIRGTTIPAADVEREWSGILSGVRAGMLAIPTRVQQRLPHLGPADVAVIDREVRDALTEIGNDVKHDETSGHVSPVSSGPPDA